MASEHSEEISRSIFREANDAFFVLHPSDLRILEANPAAQRITGKRKKQLLAMKLEDLVEQGDVAKISDLIDACQSTAQFVGSADYRLKVDGGTLPVQVSTSRIHTEPETLALLVVRDVSHTHALEEQLNHSRRMEAIGRLSTGVAHELNNLLMVINGYSHLLQDAGAASEDYVEGVRQIQSAGKRAASFTRQLLEFGSKQPASTGRLDLFEVVEGMRKMLTPLLGEHIEVETHQRRAKLWLEGDRTKLEQLIVNLAVNARDAMPSGGRLTIDASSVVLGPDDLSARPGLDAGPHLVLQVSDTGCGMDEATMARAFEPFFSTKAISHGTGLGLSMVYSTVQQSRGHIALESVVGKGTTFTIHFPATTRAPEAVAVEKVAEVAAPIGRKTILLVEDNASVRRLVEHVLQKAGYTVLSAALASDALAICELDSSYIDLVLSDYLMPGMRGDELGRRLAESRPDIRVLYMSGCVSPDGDGEDVTVLGRFLRKPFGPDELLARVREELAG